MKKENYYSIHKEERIEYARQYKKKHRQILRLKSKLYYNNHKKEIAVKRKQRRLNNIDKFRKREKEYDLKRNLIDPERSRRNQLIRDFGITIDVYNKMYEEQKGRCAICNKEFKSLCVDHSHFTNDIRGLLCHQCNLMIGNAKENIDILKNAINYLNENN
jgi:hypothetical protein